MRFTVNRAAAAGLAVAAVASAGTIAANSAPADAAVHSLRAHSILDGKAHGWSSPDDIAILGRHIFVGFQNGVPSDGPAPGTPQKSTLVELRASGQIEHTWNITGKIDGLGADVARNRVIATVNEDGNSSMWVVTLNGHAHHYHYDRALPHGGGTDAISIFNGHIFTSASNPTGNVPALYRVTLRSGGVAHISLTAINTNSTARIANAGQHHRSTQLALTDPDSNAVVPANAGRFAGQFMLDAQGDEQAIFARSLRLGAPLQVLNLAQSIDDTTFATHAGGRLIVTDSTTDTVDIVSGPLLAGAAYSSVTPGNANNAPPTPAPNYLARLNLYTGALTPLEILGLHVTPHGVDYMP